MAFARETWGARPARDLQRDGEKRTVYIHHADADGRHIRSIAQQHAALRAVQDFHMDQRGWDDIGYHYMLFQPLTGTPGPPHHHPGPEARLYACRPLWAVPAAQLEHNANSIALCVYSADEPIMPATVDRLALALKHLHERHRTLTRLLGHRDVTATECPGSHLYAALRTLRDRTGLRA